MLSSSCKSSNQYHADSKQRLAISHTDFLKYQLTRSTSPSFFPFIPPQASKFIPSQSPILPCPPDNFHSYLSPQSLLFLRIILHRQIHPNPPRTQPDPLLLTHPHTRIVPLNQRNVRPLRLRILCEDLGLCDLAGGVARRGLIG
jgi:hypothetical protein